ncbi:phosphotransferase [Streptomyces sp. NPDC002144]
MSADDLSLANDLPFLAEAFGLGEPTGHAFLPDGLMNQNWQVTTAQGRYAVKRIRDVSPETARRNLTALCALATEQIPVCAPLATSSSDVVADVRGHTYCVLPWIDGGHQRGVDLAASQVAELGIMLGRIHLALAAHPPGTMPDQVPPAKVTSVDKAVTASERFSEIVATTSTPSEFDLVVAEAMERRRVLLGKYAYLRPTTTIPLGPFGWTHGDFQCLNVLWRDGRIAAVLDWDRLGVRPYAEEVARTAQVQFGVDGRFDLQRVRDFIDGYRSVVPLNNDALLDGVRRLWWKRMTDYWQLEFHYDHGDHSCDHLFTADERLLNWWTDRLGDVEDAFTQ